MWLHGVPVACRPVHTGTLGGCINHNFQPGPGHRPLQGAWPHAWLFPRALPGSARQAGRMGRAPGFSQLHAEGHLAIRHSQGSGWEPCVAGLAHVQAQPPQEGFLGRQGGHGGQQGFRAGGSRQAGPQGQEAGRSCCHCAQDPVRARAPEPRGPASPSRFGRLAAACCMLCQGGAW